MIDVYCHELDSSTPCVCVVSDDGKLTWSPVKTTRSYVKDAASDQNSESAKDSSSDSEDLKPSQITTMGLRDSVVSLVLRLRLTMMMMLSG